MQFTLDYALLMYILSAISKSMLFPTKEYYCFSYYRPQMVLYNIINEYGHWNMSFFWASQMYSLQTDIRKGGWVNHFGWTIAYSNPKSLFFRIIPDRKTPNVELMFLWSRSLNNGGHVVCGAHQGLFGVARSARSWSTSHLTHSLGCVTTLMGLLSAPFVSLPSVCHSLPCYWI